MNQKIFQIDNPFFQVMGRCADFCILNLLFLFTSLPILTIGASLSAMHGTIRLMRENREGTLIKTYVRLWIQCFKSATKVWVILLISGMILIADFYIIFTAEGGSLQPVLLMLLTAMLTMWLMVFSWSFLDMEDQGIQTGTLSSGLKQTFFLGIKYFPYTMAMMAVELMPLIVYQLSFRLFAAFLEPIYLVIGFSLSAAICHRLSEMAL